MGLDGTRSRSLSRPGRLLFPRLNHSLLCFSFLSWLQQISLKRLEAGERRPLSVEDNQHLLLRLWSDSPAGWGRLDLARQGDPECCCCKAGQAAGGGEPDHRLDQLRDGARHNHCLHYLSRLPLVLEPGVKIPE